MATPFGWLGFALIALAGLFLVSADVKDVLTDFVWTLPAGMAVVGLALIAIEVFGIPWEGDDD
jgi:hypothetical protein